jgi:hypothetical protein
MGVRRLWHRAKGKRELYEKYVRRERNREKDSINKPSAGLGRILPNPIHVFEDLDKEDSLAGKGGRIGGREMLEHHGKEYIEEYQRRH